MHYFRRFLKKIKNLRCLFARLDEKHNSGKLLRKLWKFEKFRKKIAKNSLFYPIFNKILETLRNISRVWTKNTNCWKNFQKFLKIFDKNSIENMKFSLLLEKLMRKLEPSEITSFFSNKFFHFGGSLCSPWRRLRSLFLFR